MRLAPGQYIVRLVPSTGAGVSTRVVVLGHKSSN
jgi:hypothetical protein